MTFPNYTAAIEDDPINVKAFSAEMAARQAARYAEDGEIITVVGPRGGVSHWKPCGPIHMGRFTGAYRSKKRPA